MVIRTYAPPYVECVSRVRSSYAAPHSGLPPMTSRHRRLSSKRHPQHRPTKPRFKNAPYGKEPGPDRVRSASVNAQRGNAS